MFWHACGHKLASEGQDTRAVQHYLRLGYVKGIHVPPHQYSRKLLSILERLGCFSLRSALASIWRMRSRVTENCWPTSSSVWSVFMPMPKRMRSTRSSRGVSEASTRVVVSRRL